MNRLWVNADDFGLHEDINRAILEGVEAGRIQSFSVSANGGAVDWPALEALHRRGVPLGVHLTWVGEPWLSDGRCWGSWPALLRSLALQPRLAEKAEEEARRQAGTFLNRGITPAHLDSHQHVHVFPGLWGVTLRVARDLGIPRIRVPWAPAPGGLRPTPGGLALQWLSRRCRRAAPDARPCIGLAASGHNTRACLEQELRMAGGRDLEMVVHPGYATPALLERYGSWSYDWDAERTLIMDEAWPAILSDAGYRAG